ncbi:uncharacterized protein LOC131858616 [Cryptomeria japonica]|uniref:uncharacterized protein LOC131858616 n=1 Tax=Cryptomeria japonica TaxID=3369 RepID=UPI0027DAA721|nr:uncharacterized protein LOC131858616 [Cryptomeria japonica]
MAPKSQLARELEELKEILERERRERREQDAAREQAEAKRDRQWRREKEAMKARLEGYEKERMDHRREVNEEHYEDEGEEYHERQEHREVEDEMDPEERKLVRILKVVQNNGGKGHVEVPIYQGKMDSEEVLGWLDALENYFEYEEMEDEKRVKFAKTKLRGTALTWWTSLQNDRMCRGLTRITNWARMKNLIKEQFLPSDYSIHDEIGLQVPRTIGECYQLAIRAEEKVRRRQERSGRGGNTNRGRGGRGQGPNNDDKGKELLSESRGGYNQRGGRGFGQGRGTFRCYNCNEPGHPSFKCPKWSEDKKDRRVHLTQEDTKGEEKEPILALPKVGELLLMGKAQPSQQARIFKTNCKIHGKVCKLIVDSGACHNLVAYDVVKKLNLQTLAHPNPYFSTWVSEGQNMLVKDQVVINFSIGEYADSVLCDVMDMSCGHLILGRPWQFSRRIIHDGYKNTYLVHKGRMKYILSPLIQDGKDTTIMCFGNEFSVQEQGTRRTDLQRYKGQSSPNDEGLWDLNFVQIGAVKCPILEQRYKCGNEKFQGQPLSQLRADIQSGWEQQCPRNRHTNASFVSNNFCDVSIGWKRRTKVTFGDYLIPNQRRTAKRNHTYGWSNSWDKNFLIGGEYGARAPRRTNEDMKIEDKDF